MKTATKLFRRGRRRKPTAGMSYPAIGPDGDRGWELYRSDVCYGVKLYPERWLVVGPWGSDTPIVLSRHYKRSAAERAYVRIRKKARAKFKK